MYILLRLIRFFLYGVGVFALIIFPKAVIGAFAIGAVGWLVISGIGFLFRR